MNDADFEKYYRKGGEYVLPTEVFSDLLSDFRDLQQENQQLKEQKNKALNYIENYNSMEFRYQDNKIIDKLNIIKNILNNRLNFENEDIEVIRLKQQLKQRDEVIDETIEFARDYDFAHNNVLNFYNGVLNRLQKYKGDNNE